MVWALIALALALLVALAGWWSGAETMLGLPPESIVAAAGSAVLLALVGGGVLRHYSGRASEALRAVALWLAILLVLVAGYVYRFELGTVVNRIAGALIPGLQLVSEGSVTVSRAAGGHFLLTGRINGHGTRLMFDTGASTIVLRAEEAAAMGIHLTAESFTVPVATANGMTRAAPVTLREVRIGDITERGVRALVAQPGTLLENLLGMSFLERLHSYEVRSDQLVLRARG